MWERTLDATEELEEVIEACQRSLDLRHGPLLRALLAALPDGSQRLLLVVHHLVVDGVSWRILLEDLQQAYQALATGEMPHLPAKTSSFKVWAERVQEHARGRHSNRSLPTGRHSFRACRITCPATTLMGDVS